MSYDAHIAHKIWYTLPKTAFVIHNIVWWMTPKKASKINFLRPPAIAPILWF